MRLALLLLVLAACGPTSYGKATSSKLMGVGRYMITVRGKRITSDLLLEYVDRRARELCGGDYDVEQQSGGNESRTWTDQTSGNTYTKTRMDASVIVRCR